MTNVFVLVQGRETRDQLQQVVSQQEVHEQQVASQQEVHEQQVASQLEVHEQQLASQQEVHEQQTANQLEVFGQQLKEVRTTQEKTKETKMTGKVFRQILHGEGNHIPLVGIRSRNVGVSVLYRVGVSVLCRVGVSVLY